MRTLQMECLQSERTAKQDSIPWIKVAYFCWSLSNSAFQRFIVLKTQVLYYERHELYRKRGGYGSRHIVQCRIAECTIHMNSNSDSFERMFNFGAFVHECIYMFYTHRKR